ncbi:MlaC/ttg2D family ABC transporter substrate-binding protein [Alteromonas facilis]|uniref:MlaC/ttg2D family ABC transporter substrate-binding protein n=1 Tax=Alteromonas facilis TaxID=2048004 RepID=UPI001F0C9E7F|nr:ABC transporter substrate-binding protein [Alteromonas facilis]
MRNWLLGLFAASLLCVSTARAEIESTDPYVMVQSVAVKTFDRIKREQSEIEQEPEKLRVIMKEELVPYIDYKYAAFMVLGKHFRSVPKEKLNEYVSVFREYLITSYAIAMGYYDNQEVIFEPSSDWKDKKTVTVRAVIKDDVRPDINVAFKVTKNKNTNEWRAYDMIAEGISVVDSKRSEFEGILRQDGIDKVIEIMRNSIDKPIVLQTKES